MEKLLKPKEAAERLCINPDTLCNWRNAGRGPTFKRVGKRVFYTETDLEAFLVRNTVSPEEGIKV